MRHKNKFYNHTVGNSLLWLKTAWNYLNINLNEKNMNYICALISVKNIVASRKFYEDLFGLKIKFDFGKNISNKMVLVCGQQKC